MIGQHIEDWIFQNRSLGGARHVGIITAGTITVGGVLTAGALAATAVGTGLSVYSSMQQGAAAQANANGNAAIMAANAKIQLQSDRMQALGEINDAQLSEKQAAISGVSGRIDEANAYLKGLSDTLQTNAAAKNSLTSAKQYNIDASLSRMSANTLNSYGRATEMQGREQIARFREQGARVIAVANNRVAKSGIVSEGSPLAVLADNAAKIELHAQDIAYETELTARSYDREAYNQRLQGKRSLLSAREETQNARTSLKSGRLAQTGMKFSVAGAQLEQAGAKAAGEAAQFREAMGHEAYDLAGEKYQVAMGQSDLTKSSGAAMARGAMLSAIGTGISGASSLAGSAAGSFRTAA